LITTPPRLMIAANAPQPRSSAETNLFLNLLPARAIMRKRLTMMATVRAPRKDKKRRMFSL